MVDIVTSVQQFYDAVGAHFSRTRQKTYGSGTSTNWPVTDQYLAKLQPGQSVLDIGCGNGKLVSGLPDGVSYLGTDFSQTLLDEARKLHPEHDFHFGSIVKPAHWEKLGQYEAIFCVAVLHHIPEKEQQLFILREAKKHLTKDGSLFLTVWNLWQDKFAEYKVGDHFEVPYDKKWMRYCVPYTLQSLSDLCMEAGLVVEEIFYADASGQKSDIEHGQNLVVVAS